MLHQAQLCRELDEAARELKDSEINTERLELLLGERAQLVGELQKEVPT